VEGGPPRERRRRIALILGKGVDLIYSKKKGAKCYEEKRNLYDFLENTREKEKEEGKRSSSMLEGCGFPMKRAKILSQERKEKKKNNTRDKQSKKKENKEKEELPRKRGTEKIRSLRLSSNEEVAYISKAAYILPKREEPHFSVDARCCGEGGASFPPGKKSKKRGMPALLIMRNEWKKKRGGVPSSHFLNCLREVAAVQ